MRWLHPVPVAQVGRPKSRMACDVLSACGWSTSSAAGLPSIPRKGNNRSDAVASGVTRSASGKVNLPTPKRARKKTDPYHGHVGWTGRVASACGRWWGPYRAGIRPSHPYAGCLVYAHRAPVQPLGAEAHSRAPTGPGEHSH